MAVRSRTYTAIGGLYTLTVPELAYRNITSVKREGLGYNIVSSSPVGRQVQYVPGTGGFTFETVFSGPGVIADIVDIVPEKIFIIWDE